MSTLHISDFMYSCVPITMRGNYNTRWLTNCVVSMYLCSSRKLKNINVVRVPAISLKMADIPTDQYSWRKYGQKPIKGSPHPRYIHYSFSTFIVMRY